ncbi:MAG TPA: class I SAM-dependent methyltransferase, partial [Acidimicrobiales bacterium]|nr:class I SAM-dependent methyltransferase [Acidimicrobiales bacterium]
MIPDYYDLLDRVHRHLRPRTYVEIGVQRGLSLRSVGQGTTAIGIDPEAPAEPPEEASATIRLFAETSDDFFAQHDLRAELDGRDLDLGFIDGLHLFEYALRDFVNLERHCHAGSVILVHDCIPLDEECASRERKTVAWTGDVWKLIACLRAERPDLDVATADVPPTGMAVITGLDPSSTALSEG